MGSFDRILNKLIPHADSLSWTRLPLVRALQGAKHLQGYNSDRTHPIPEESDLRLVAITASIVMTVEQFDGWQRSLHKHLCRHSNTREQQSFSSSLDGGMWGPLFDIYNVSARISGNDYLLTDLGEEVALCEVFISRFLPSFVVVTFIIRLSDDARSTLTNLIGTYRNLPVKFGKVTRRGFSIAGTDAREEHARRLRQWFSDLLEPALDVARLPRYSVVAPCIPVFVASGPADLFDVFNDGLRIGWERIGVDCFGPVYRNKVAFIQTSAYGSGSPLVIVNSAHVTGYMKELDDEDYMNATWHSVQFLLAEFWGMQAVFDRLTLLEREIARDRAIFLKLSKRLPLLPWIIKLHRECLADWVIVDRIIRDSKASDRYLRHHVKDLRSFRFASTGDRFPAGTNLGRDWLEELEWRCQRLETESSHLRSLIVEFMTIRNSLFTFASQWSAIIIALLAIGLTIWQLKSSQPNTVQPPLSPKEDRGPTEALKPPSSPPNGAAGKLLPPKPSSEKPNQAPLRSR